MVWFGGLASVVVARCFEPGGGRMVPCLDTGGIARSAVPFSFWVFYFHTGSRLVRILYPPDGPALMGAPHVGTHTRACALEH